MNRSIEEDIIGRLIKWLKGFDGRIPTLSITELILKIFKQYDLGYNELTTTDVVKAVRELRIKEGSQAEKLRDGLVTTWKRGILNAKSGAMSQKTTNMKIDDKFKENSNMEKYSRSEALRRQHHDELKREKMLKQKGVKVISNPYVKKTPTKILFRVNKIKN